MRRASVSPLAARSESGNAMQIDLDRLVNDPHRSATQINGLIAFARHQFIMLKSLHRLFPFAPQRTGLSIGRNDWKGLQGVPPMKRAPFYAVGSCTASSYFMKKTSSYRHRADRLRPASRGPPSPLPPAQGRSAGHRLSCCPPRHPLSTRRHSF